MSGTYLHYPFANLSFVDQKGPFTLLNNIDGRSGTVTGFSVKGTTSCGFLMFSVIRNGVYGQLIQMFKNSTLSSSAPGLAFITPAMLDTIGFGFLGVSFDFDASGNVTYGTEDTGHNATLLNVLLLGV